MAANKYCKVLKPSWDDGIHDVTQVYCGNLLFLAEEKRVDHPMICIECEPFEEHLTAVIWPYDDCKLFSRGDIVFYRGAYFYHPKKEKWIKSIRPNIRRDTCSISTISMGMIRSELPMGDIKIAEPSGN